MPSLADMTMRWRQLQEWGWVFHVFERSDSEIRIDGENNLLGGLGIGYRTRWLRIGDYLDELGFLLDVEAWTRKHI